MEDYDRQFGTWAEALEFALFAGILTWSKHRVRRSRDGLEWLVDEAPPSAERVDIHAMGMSEPIRHVAVEDLGP